jgi:hypothetical protein
MTVQAYSATTDRQIQETLYSCFDFNLRSSIALPEMASAAPDNGDRDVVDIRVGDLPVTLPGALETLEGLQFATRAVLLSVEGIGRYLIRDGREIIVAPAEGCSLRNLRLFLLGSALGILCHQRGLLLLHANACIVNGRAVAFAGPSGAGKSTLAAYFQRAGYDVLCDDVCGISFDGDGRPLAWPGIPRLKLWGEAATTFGYDRATLDLAIDGMDKYHVPLAVAPPPRAAPFDRLYLLERAMPGDKGTIKRLRGARSMEAVASHTYRGQYLDPMGLGARHFTQCTALLRNARIYVATRQWGYDVFDREAANLDRHMQDLA